MLILCVVCVHACLYLHEVLAAYILRKILARSQLKGMEIFACVCVFYCFCTFASLQND